MNMQAFTPVNVRYPFSTHLGVTCQNFFRCKAAICSSVARSDLASGCATFCAGCEAERSAKASCTKREGPQFRVR